MEGRQLSPSPRRLMKIRNSPAAKGKLLSNLELTLDDTIVAATPVRLLLQRCRKVCNHADGLADRLRNPVQKDFPAVGGNIVENLRSRPIGDERLSKAELHGAARVLYRYREKIVSRVHIVELFSVLAPSGEQSSVGRDLPLALPAAKSHHIHFHHTGFVRLIGEPTPSGESSPRKPRGMTSRIDPGPP